MQLTIGNELAHGGVGLARVDGRVVFVEGALPGETVEAEVVHKRKDFWRAQTREVLDPSPERVQPRCVYFGSCGGCQVQHLAYAQQLAHKRQVLQNQLKRARIEWPLERIEVLGMQDPWRYRLRGEFHVLRQSGSVGLGFYRKHTYQTLPIDSCLIHMEAIERSLPALARAAADPAAAAVQAIQLTWAEASGELLWAAYPPGSADPGFAQRAAQLLPDVRFNDDSIGLDDDGRHFRVRPETFVQVNARQRDRLYERALRDAGLSPDERVVDAYSGIGMLSARLAARAQAVTCLEESPYAVRLGELNMQLNDCHNVFYRRGLVEDTLPQIKEPVDVLVLDPPRAGCAEAALVAVRQAAPERIVFISCEPSTLARDLGRLCSDGRFSLTDVTLVDMFPQTYHLETVVRLERS